MARFTISGLIVGAVFPFLCGCTELRHVRECCHPLQDAWLRSVHCHGCEPVRFGEPTTCCEPCDNCGNYIGPGPAYDGYYSTPAETVYESEPVMVEPQPMPSGQTARRSYYSAPSGPGTPRTLRWMRNNWSAIGNELARRHQMSQLR